MLEPPGLAHSNASLQQRKSSDMRLTILKTAADCLADVGYSHTTMQLIAKRAKISRGAMMHHYTDRRELIESIVDYVIYCHADQFSRAVRGLTENERLTVLMSVEIDWQRYQSKVYQAFLELTNASRTDPDLRAIFLPRTQRLDQVWRDELMTVFSEYADIEILKASHRYCQAVLSGMLINRPVWNDPDIERRLILFLSNQLIALRDGHISIPEL